MYFNGLRCTTLNFGRGVTCSIHPDHLKMNRIHGPPGVSAFLPSCINTVITTIEEASESD